MTSFVKRTCGDCTLCCKVMAIEALAKPANAWCRHCKPGRGCAIYAERPAECESFACLWLVNDLLDERWKPSRSKLVLTTSEDGIEVRCDPGFPDAWRKQQLKRETERLGRRKQAVLTQLASRVGDDVGGHAAQDSVA